MSVIQSQQREVRYLKRKNLEEESKIIGNALRDQIRQYGIDCMYYKLDTSDYINFKDVIDQNTLLRRAYGYNTNPDYSLSVHMIAYADMQQDVFLLNKIGMNPNVELDFYFDRIDFACALAPKCGQLKEYQIDEEDIFCEVPDNDDLSAFPFDLSVGGISPRYTCGMLSGRFKAEISSYEYGEEYTMMCFPYQHTSFKVEFPANDDLYLSLKHTIENDDYLETLILLTYRVEKVDRGDGLSVNLLSGYVHGSVLFYDISQIGKYVSLIHPSVGDIVEIDFPDDQNREKYEITDCFDRQLTQDGINPLLHKYVWKCKARRYINSFEDNTPQTEADDRVEEMHRYENTVDSKISEHISMYDELSNGITEDAVYGGMGDTLNKYNDINKDILLSGDPDGLTDSYDKQVPDVHYDKYDFIDDGTAIDLIKFGSGSRLLTDGYNLLFMNKLGEFYQIATNTFNVGAQPPCMLEQNLRWLKATDSEIVFINVEGESTAIVVDVLATQGQLEICLNSLFDKTLDTCQPINKNDQNFYKFKGTKTYMWSDGMHLYAKLASSKALYMVDGIRS